MFVVSKVYCFGFTYLFAVHLLLNFWIVDIQNYLFFCLWYTFQLMLHILAHGTYPNSWYISKLMVHIQAHGTYPSSCYHKDINHSLWYISKLMVHILTHGTYPRSWYISKLMVHIQAHGTCTYSSSWYIS